MPQYYDQYFLPSLIVMNLEPAPAETQYPNGATRREHATAMRLEFDQDRLPDLPNGYRFVVDQPENGNTTDLINNVPYTAYFSRREVPVSARGHNERGHDAGHGISYFEMLSVEELANTLQQAALNAPNIPGGCERFANSLDKFADYLEVVALFRRMDAPLTRETALAAQTRLLEIIALARPDLDEASPELAGIRERLTAKFGVDAAALKRLMSERVDRYTTYGWYGGNLSLQDVPGFKIEYDVRPPDYTDRFGGRQVPLSEKPFTDGLGDGSRGEYRPLTPDQPFFEYP